MHFDVQVIITQVITSELECREMFAYCRYRVGLHSTTVQAKGFIFRLTLKAVRGDLLLCLSTC